MIVLRKGRVIRDDNGDVVCTVARTLQTGDPIMVDDFDWKIDKPVPGQELHPAIVETLQGLV